MCFVGTGREILNFNLAERLDDHPFLSSILGLPAFKINVPFSLVLSGRRVTNHVLVFSICAPLKVRVVFLCKAFFALYAVMTLLYRSFCTFSWLVPYVNEVKSSRSNPS